LKLIPRRPFHHITKSSLSASNNLTKIIPSPSLQKDKQTDTTPANKNISFQGNIAAIAMENIFQLLDFAALTGKLEVNSPGNTGNFYFTKGVLTSGMLQINHRKIGEILLESQLITEEQLQECLRLHKQSQFQRRFGQILLEKNYIQPSILDDSLLRQIKEAFFEALSWQEGTFIFYQNQVPSPGAIRLQARVDHLLLEGMVYIDNTESPEP
jgi:hypothetical protein